jgi:phage replication-related protein YjqB (UPF0714/DUF867 family)
MPDKYFSFAALARAEPPNAFSITTHDGGSSLVIVAPHGGGIEPGTSEIALAVAGGDLSYYLFEGKKSEGNADLHITSSNFDEPECLKLLKSADTVITVHGEGGDDEVVYLGGRDEVLLAAIEQSLQRHGFAARKHGDSDLQGRHPRNICNMGCSGAGVQLELSRGLRRSFFASLSREGRLRPSRRLPQFVTALRPAITPQRA